METSPLEDLPQEKRVGLIEFYENVFGWRVIDWDADRKTWKLRPSLSKGYRDAGRSFISLNPQASPYTGDEAEFNSLVGAIEVDNIEKYTQKIIEWQGHIDDGDIIRNPDGSRINFGRDSTGRTFVLVELLNRPTFGP